MTCMRLAELADLPLGLVLGTIGAAYAPNEEEAAVWRKLAEEAGGDASSPWMPERGRTGTRRGRGAASRGTGAFGFGGDAELLAVCPDLGGVAHRNRSVRAPQY
ncbi:hypothetical protein GCM10025759_04950 [Lysobacter panacisoli]|uniref:Uncharacterized protein n=1 Tax=Lysobacter panacisoli TaxID=1255263 RepID=A0ABP9L0A8_9GAMM